MGRKRTNKAVEGSSTDITTVKEKDETSNAFQGTTTSTNEISLLQPDNSSAMNIDKNVQPYIDDAPKKKSNVTQVFTRRTSKRLKNSGLPSESQGAGKAVAEHVNLVDNEKEKEEATKSQQVIISAPMPVLMEKKNSEEESHEVIEQVIGDVAERNSGEKIDSVVRSDDETKSKIPATPNESPCPAFNYKSLYIDAQKKIDVLMEENYNLVRRLEFANGKIEAYEKMNGFVGALKEMVLVSSGPGKGTDGTMNSSPQMDDPADANGDESKPKTNKYTKKKKNTKNKV